MKYDLGNLVRSDFAHVDFRTIQEVEVSRCLRKAGESRCQCGKAADAACVHSTMGRNKRVKRLARAMER